MVGKGKDMKTKEWLNPNKMKIETEHKTFNQQTRVIGAGNIIATTQVSLFIRAWNNTYRWDGDTVEPGYLQNFDLTAFRLPKHIEKAVRDTAVDESVILYEFRHFNGDKKIVHGYVITDGEYRLLRTFVTGPTWKSNSVIKECLKYIVA